jgi:hypothetical protein
MSHGSGSAVAVALLLSLPALARGAEAASGRKPLTAEVMWQMARLGPPSLSPDGKWAALAVTSPDAKADKAPSEIWLVRRATSASVMAGTSFGDFALPTKPVTLAVPFTRCQVRSSISICTSS